MKAIRRFRQRHEQDTSEQSPTTPTVRSSPAKRPSTPNFNKPRQPPSSFPFPERQQSGPDAPASGPYDLGHGPPPRTPRKSATPSLFSRMSHSTPDLLSHVGNSSGSSAVPAMQEPTRPGRPPLTGPSQSDLVVGTNGRHAETNAQPPTIFGRAARGVFSRAAARIKPSSQATESQRNSGVAGEDQLARAGGTSATTSASHHAPDDKFSLLTPTTTPILPPERSSSTTPSSFATPTASPTRLPAPQLPAATTSRSSLAPPRVPWLHRGSSSNAPSNTSMLSLSDPLTPSNDPTSAPPTPATDEGLPPDSLAPSAAALRASHDVGTSPYGVGRGLAPESKDGRWRRIRSSSFNLLKKHDKAPSSTEYTLEEPTRPPEPAFSQMYVQSPLESPLGHFSTPTPFTPVQPQTQSHGGLHSSDVRSPTLGSPPPSHDSPVPSSSVDSFDPRHSQPTSAPRTELPTLPPLSFDLDRPSRLSLAAPLDGIALTPGQVVDPHGQVFAAIPPPLPEKDQHSAAPVLPRTAADHEEDDVQTPVRTSSLLPPAMQPVPSTSSDTKRKPSLQVDTTLKPASPVATDPRSKSPHSATLPDYLVDAINFEPDLSADTPALGPQHLPPIDTNANQVPSPAPVQQKRTSQIQSAPAQDLSAWNPEDGLEEGLEDGLNYDQPATTTGPTRPAPKRTSVVAPVAIRPGVPTPAVPDKSRPGSAPISTLVAPSREGRSPSPGAAINRNRPQSSMMVSRGVSPAARSVRSPSPGIKSNRRLSSSLANAGAFKRGKSPTPNSTLLSGESSRTASPAPTQARPSGGPPDILSVLDSGAKRALYNCTLLKLQPRICVALKEAMASVEEPGTHRASIMDVGSPLRAATPGGSMVSSALAAAVTSGGGLSTHMRALMATATTAVNKGLVIDLLYPRSMNSPTKVEVHESAYSPQRNLRAALGRSAVLTKLLSVQPVTQSGTPLPRHQAQEIASLQIRYGRDLVPPAVVRLASRPGAQKEALAAPAVVAPGQAPGPAHGLARWVNRAPYVERCQEWLASLDGSLTAQPISGHHVPPLDLSLRMNALVAPEGLPLRDAVPPSAGPAQPGRQRRTSVGPITKPPKSTSPAPTDSPFRRRRISQGIPPSNPRVLRDKRLSTTSNWSTPGTGASTPTLETESPTRPSTAAANRMSAMSTTSSNASSGLRRSAPWLPRGLSDTTADDSPSKRQSTLSMMPTSGSHASLMPSASGEYLAPPSSTSPLALRPVHTHDDDVREAASPFVPRSPSVPSGPLGHTRQMSQGSTQEIIVEGGNHGSDSEEEQPLSQLWSKRSSAQTPVSRPVSIASSPGGRTSPAPQLRSRSRPPSAYSNRPGSAMADTRPRPAFGRSGSAMDRPITPRVTSPVSEAVRPSARETQRQSTTSSAGHLRGQSLSTHERELAIQEAHKAMLKQNRERRRTSRGPQALLDPTYGAGHASARSPSQAYAGLHAKSATDSKRSSQDVLRTDCSATQKPDIVAAQGDSRTSGSGSGTSGGTSGQPETPEDHGVPPRRPASLAGSLGGNGTPRKKSPAGARSSLGGMTPGRRSPGPDHALMGRRSPGPKHAPLVDLSRDSALSRVAPRSVVDDDGDTRSTTRSRPHVHHSRRPGSQASMVSAPGATTTRDSSMQQANWYQQSLMGKGGVPAMPSLPGMGMPMQAMQPMQPMQVQAMQQQMQLQHMQLQQQQMQWAMWQQQQQMYAPHQAQSSPGHPGRRRKDTAF